MQWKLEDKIGKGGNGIVFRASSTDSQLAAVKLLTSLRGDHFSRFETEIRALQACRGDNIVPILDSGYMDYQGKPTPFYAMPIYRANLRNLIKLNPAGFEIEQCLYFFEKLLTALDVMHEKGILHRDIKPENILIDEKGSPYLGDFGLAKAYSKKAQYLLGYGLTRTNNKAAPANYMSPEQLMYINDKKIILDERSDLFQMGKVFYECLTGNNPLGQVSSPKEDDKKHVFIHIVSPLIRQNIEERPKSAKTILDLLSTIRVFGIESSQTLSSGNVVWAEIQDEATLTTFIADSSRVVWHRFEWTKNINDNYVKPLPNETQYVHPLFNALNGNCIGYFSVLGNYPDQKIVYSFLKQNQGKYGWSNDHEISKFTPATPETATRTSTHFDINKKKIEQKNIPEFEISSCGITLQDNQTIKGIYIIGQLGLDVWLIHIDLTKNVISYQKYIIPGYLGNIGLYSIDVINKWQKGKVNIGVDAQYYNYGDGGGPSEFYSYEFLLDSNILELRDFSDTNFKITLQGNPYRRNGLNPPLTYGSYQNFKFEDLSIKIRNDEVLEISSPNEVFPACSLSTGKHSTGVLATKSEISLFRSSNSIVKVDKVVQKRPYPYKFHLPKF